MFRPDFADWLLENWHVYEAFEREAMRVRRAGCDHYSARTIGEFLRHQTMVCESGGEFKISDWWWPNLARLYMQMNPREQGFFETRCAPARGMVAA